LINYGLILKKKIVDEEQKKVILPNYEGTDTQADYQMISDSIIYHPDSMTVMQYDSSN